jgi:hypothetical protein
MYTPIFSFWRKQGIIENEKKMSILHEIRIGDDTIARVVTDSAELSQSAKQELKEQVKGYEWLFEPEKRQIVERIDEL